jgi:hypothetical protein
MSAVSQYLCLSQYRAIGDIPNPEFAMNIVFWIGVYPALTRSMIVGQFDEKHSLGD